MGNKPRIIGRFVEQTPGFAPPLGVTKFQLPEEWFWSHFVVLLKSNLDVQTQLWIDPINSRLVQGAKVSRNAPAIFIDLNHVIEHI